MSETPQEKAAEWVVRESGKWEDALGRRWEIVEPEIREAIRALLDLVRVQYTANEEMTRLLAQAEAALRWCDEFAPGIAAQARIAALRDTTQREECVCDSAGWRHCQIHQDDGGEP